MVGEEGELERLGLLALGSAASRDDLHGVVDALNLKAQVRKALHSARAGEMAVELILEATAAAATGRRRAVHPGH